MNKEIVSLKNIYRLLTEKDYPIYSDGVFKNKEGLTLSKFWHTVILPDFKNGKYGFMIFRTEGARSKYFSLVCNRSDNVHFKDKYALELDVLFLENSEDIVKRQACNFKSFLKNKDFSYDILMDKLKAFIVSTLDYDPAVNKAARDRINALTGRIDKYRNDSFDAQAQYTSVILTFLYANALYGAKFVEERRMDSVFDACMAILGDEGRKSAQTKDMTILGNPSNTLWREPLNSYNYFGRDRELFEIYERVRENHHVFISGQEGTGKTELLRQLLKRFLDDKLYETILTVPYEKDLTTTLSSVLPASGEAFHGKDIFYEAMAMIRSHEGERLLVMIDGIDASFEADTHFGEFMDMEADIIVTGTIKKLTGFTPYRVSVATVESRELIFRDHYFRPLKQGENSDVRKLLDDSELKKISNVIALARMASRREISCQNILKEYRNATLASANFAATAFIKNLSKREKEILGFLAWSSKERYTREFLVRIFCDSSFGRLNFQAVLETLDYLGLIEQDNDCVACVSSIKKAVSENVDVDDLLCRITENIREQWASGFALLEEYSIKADEIFEEFSEDDANYVYISLAYYGGQSTLSADEARFAFMCLYLSATRRDDLPKNVEADLKGFLMKTTTFIRECRTREVLECYIYCIYASREAYSNKMKQYLSEEMENRTLPISYIVRMALAYYDGKNAYNIDLSFAEECFKWALERAENKRQSFECYMGLSACAAINSHFTQQKEYAEMLEKLAQNRSDRLNAITEKSSAYFGLKDTMELGKIYNSTKDDTFIASSQKIEISSAYGMCLCSDGYMEKGLKLCQEALDLCYNLYGGKSSMYACALVRFATSLEKAERYEEAENAYLTAIERLKSAGNMQSVYRVSRNNLGVLYNKLDEPVKALEIYNEIGPSMEAGDDQSRGEYRNNLSISYELLKEYSKSLKYCDEAYELLKGIYGESNKRIIENRERHDRLTKALSE